MGILSIAVVKSAGVTTNYFAKDDYYTKEGTAESVSQWYGKGAQALGLSGQVSAEEFGPLLEGRLPDGTHLGRISTVTFPEAVNLGSLLKGQDLETIRLNDVLNMKLENDQKVSQLFDPEKVKALRSVRPSELLSIDGNSLKVRHHRPGWDFTFSAPKSISILYEVGGDERLRTAHEKAVGQALDFLEGHGVQTRVVDKAGRHFVQTGNLIIARFTHDTSRELDPQLHTHSFVMNATQLENGEWRSIESRSLYQLKMLGGAIYKAALARAVKDLGYEVERTHADGRFEATVVPKEVVKAFSRRRQQIEDRLKDSYVNDAKSAEEAALKTRGYKREEDRDTLRGIWGSMAKAMGFDVEKVVTEHRLLDHVVATDEHTRDGPSAVHRRLPLTTVSEQMLITSAAEAVTFAAAKLGEREAVFIQEDLLWESLTHAIGDATLPDVEAAIETFAKEKKLISATLDGGIAWTTPNAIYLERSNIAIMRAGQHHVPGMYRKEELQTVLDQRGFTPGQRGAAELILTTNDRVMGVQGFAGTGKTYMLDTVRELAQARGFTVRGFSQSAAAANVLQQEADIPSSTIAQHLVDLKKQFAQASSQMQEDPLSQTQCDKQVWVVDEASMVSSRGMYEFLKLSERTGARVVLVGDKKQLPAVEAGKPFAQLQRAGMAVAEMRNILRQKITHLRAAVYDSIDGQIRRAIEKIKDNVHEIDDKQSRLSAIVNQYLRLPPDERERTLVLSPANEDRVALNQLIREGLHHDGTLSGDRAESVALTKEGLTEIERARASSYKAGQVIRFNRGYRSLGVEKGEYVRIAQVDGKKGVVTLQALDKSKIIEWSPHLVGGKSRKGAVTVFREEKRDLMRGDKVRWTDNSKSRGLFNAEQACVEKVDGNMVTFRLANGEQLTLDIHQPENKHWDHVYTSTVFSGQGRTADRVIVHGEDWRRNLVNQKSFYVGISRPKLHVDIYLNDKEKFIRAVEERTGEKVAALESVRRDGIDTEQKKKMSEPTRFGGRVDRDGLVPDNLDYNALDKQRDSDRQRQAHVTRYQQALDRDSSR